MIESLKKKLKAHRPEPLGCRQEFAVLLPLIEGEDGYELLYQVRAPHIPQGGETSFPGGALEEGEDPVSAAVRETCEEIGTSPEQIEILGELNYLVSERVLIYAFVGLLKHYEPTEDLINKEEVEQVVPVSLAWLKDNPPASFQLAFRAKGQADFPWDRIPDGEEYSWSRQGREVVFYPLPESGLNIWGFTAQITRELCRMITESEI